MTSEPKNVHADDPSNPCWVIDEADIFSVPRSAHCSLCQYEWVRPETDHNAGTLGPVAAAHNRSAHAGQRMTWQRNSGPRNGG